jgi:hypothetical protein
MDQRLRADASRPGKPLRNGQRTRKLIYQARLQGCLERLAERTVDIWLRGMEQIPKGMDCEDSKCLAELAHALIFGPAAWA